MARKRKTPKPEELKLLARRQRIAAAFMKGDKVDDIAKAERISVHSVRRDIAAAREVVLPAATREMLAARSCERLESVVRATQEGKERGEAEATRNFMRAVDLQNKMLGLTGTANDFAPDTEQKANRGYVINIVRVTPDPNVNPALREDNPIGRRPEPQPPRLLEYRPEMSSPPAPSTPEPAPQRPPTYDDTPPVRRRAIQWEIHPLFDPKAFAPGSRTEFEGNEEYAELLKPWHKRRLRKSGRRK